MTQEQANQLKGYLKSIGVTQEDIAAKFGTSQAYISNLISGKIPFGKKNAKRMSEIYGLSESWLLVGEGEMVKSGIKIDNSINSRANRDSSITVNTADASRVQALEREIEHLNSQLDDYKKLIENYKTQVNQLLEMLERK